MYPIDSNRLIIMTYKIIVGIQAVYSIGYLMC